MIHSFSKIKTDMKYNEDFKTYQTIGLMQYLPASLFWHIIRECVISPNNLPHLSGEILQTDFWIKWYNIDNTNAERYVEPDVFIRFENFDCIIEVKKTEGSGQHHDQWDDQITSYRNTYPEGKRLIYIALGGNKDYSTGFDNRFSDVYRASWRRLLHAVHKALDERTTLHYQTSAVSQEIRILQSIMEAFKKYNEYDVEFLDSLISIPEIDLTTKEFEKLWIY